MSFLGKIRALKLEQVQRRKALVPLANIMREIKRAKHSFSKALVKKKGVALIAEFKKSSPSRGSINRGAILGDYVKLYDKYANAISILTEPDFFSGKPEDIKEARKHTKKPILRKDFIVDEYEIYEARKLGADAVLLIAGFLPLEQLKRFVKVAQKLGLDALVECDSEKTLGDALESGSRVIGINNRNLDTMEEDFSTTERLLALIPGNVRKRIVIVSESAIHSGMQIMGLEGKADAVLVGTSIMSSPIPAVKLKELTGRTLTKICGVTNRKDALDAVQLGADIIGLNFYEKSPRRITVRRAKSISRAVRGKALVAGIFVNEASEKVEIIAREAGLDLLQFSGDESPAYTRRFALPVIKAVHMKDESSLELINGFDSGFVMLDSFAKGSFGGSGKRFDTGLLDMKKLAGKSIVFSGGLNEKNVKGVIEKFRPAIVDVCSGVESSPGVKSHVKMRAFIDAVMGCS